MTPRPCPDSRHEFYADHVTGALRCRLCGLMVALQAISGKTALGRGRVGDAVRLAEREWYIEALES